MLSGAQLDAPYREQLPDSVTCAMAPADGLDGAHHIFAIVLDDGVDRVAFRDALRGRGIQTSIHYPYATKSRGITSLKPQQHGLHGQAVSGRATATQMSDRRRRAAGRARRVRCR